MKILLDVTVGGVKIGPDHVGKFTSKLAPPFRISPHQNHRKYSPHQRKSQT